MFEPLYIIYADTFLKLQEEGKDCWCILNLSVPLRLLNELYIRFTTKDGIEPLEKLPLETKTKYWNISKKFYTDTTQRIKASKAAYVLSLITSTE